MGGSSQFKNLLYISDIKNIEEYQRDLAHTLNQTVYWLNTVRSDRMAQKHKVLLLYQYHLDIDLYGPMKNCSTEMEGGEKNEIQKAIHLMTMIDLSKDTHVQIQKKTCFFCS
jgi:hypothetical protein